MAMTRLSYDCPIIAAYMAKYFGVALGYYQRHIQYPFVTITDTSPNGLLMSDAKGKYYIHPDSEHIFRPQGGDLVIFHGQIGLINDLWAPPWTLDLFNGPPLPRPLSYLGPVIINRMGQQFFAPKKEAE